MCFLRKGRELRLHSWLTSQPRALSWCHHKGEGSVQVPLSLGVFQESKNQTERSWRLEAFVFWCGVWVILASRPALSSLALQHLPLSHFITPASDVGEGMGPSSTSRPKQFPATRPQVKLSSAFNFSFLICKMDVIIIFQDGREVQQ